MTPAQTRSGAPRPGARAPWGTINRERIVDAAVRAVRTWGYEQLTIRKLAGELGVSPMAIYQHVRDKTDLLDDVVDRLLARAWKPKADSDDWRAWVTEAADRLRRFLVAQPAALHVYLAHPVVSPTAVARMDTMLDVLFQALDDDRSAQQAYAAIHTFTVGFAALEASRSGWQPSEAHQETMGPSGVGSNRAGDESQMSAPSELVARLATYTTPDQFQQGLGYLLDGIANGIR